MSEVCGTWDSLGGGSVVRTLGQDLAGPCMNTEASLCWPLEGLAWYPQALMEGPI